MLGSKMTKKDDEERLLYHFFFQYRMIIRAMFRRFLGELNCSRTYIDVLATRGGFGVLGWLAFDVETLNCEALLLPNSAS